MGEDDRDGGCLHHHGEQLSTATAATRTGHRVVPDTTYLLTRRRTQRRFMLVPRSIVPKLFGDCVALASKRHGILVHAIICMSNHWHAVVTDPRGHTPELSRGVHSLTARALNAHLRRWEALQAPRPRDKHPRPWTNYEPMMGRSPAQ